MNLRLAKDKTEDDDPGSTLVQPSENQCVLGPNPEGLTITCLTLAKSVANVKHVHGTAQVASAGAWPALASAGPQH